MTLLRWLSFWSVFLGSSLVWAAPRLPSKCDPNDSKSCVQYLFKGEAATFDGLQMTPRRAAKLGVRADQCDERVGTAAAESDELWEIKLSLEQQKRDNDGEAAQDRVDFLKDQLAKAAVPFYKEPMFVATVTAVMVSAIFIGASK